jgi:hypothetical protein
MTRTSTALALALSASSALAQDYNRQDLVRGLCQKDGCDEFTVLAADRVRATDEGTLFKTRLKTFHASHAGRKDRGEENGYVFCSPTRPAIMAEHNEQTLAFFLAPFATHESRESVRKNANFHALYFAICHGREAGKAAVHSLAGVAQIQGYRVTLGHSKLVLLQQAEDVLTRDQSERAPVKVRHEERQERPAVEERRYERQQAPANVVESEGVLAGARRLTDRAFDRLDELGDWMIGRGR